MSFINTLFPGFLHKKSAINEDAYIDINGKQIFKQDIEAFVLNELERRRDERRTFELQWQLNTNFLYGNQRCDINKMSGTIEQYELPYDSMENEVFNQIEPLFKTRLAHLNKLRYSMTVKPRTSELDDIAKANVSTSLLRYKQSISGFNAFKTTLISWCEITGTAFILNWWDAKMGDKVGFFQTAELDDSVLYSGDVAYGLLSPYEVYPESIYKQDVKDQRSIIVEQVMSVDDIYDLYGVEVEGEAVEAYAMSTVEGAGGFGYIANVAKITSRTAENSKKVITFFEKKSRRYPDGRLIIIIGDKLHYYGPLPYDNIPIIAVKSDEVAGQFFGRSFIQSLIPLQRAYNGMMNTAHDYIKRLPTSTVAMEEGAVEDMDEFSENLFQPGGILVYKTGFNPPKFMSPPDFPGDIYNQIEKIKSDMEYVAGVSQLMVYGQKSGVTSGTAIQSLAEIDNTRLSVTGENIRNAVIETAKTWLEIYKKCANGFRPLRIVGGNDAGNVLIWSSEDINSYDIKFDTENELIFGEDAQRQNFLTLFNMGLFTDENGRIPEGFKKTAIEHFRIGDSDAITGTNELQRQKANRENGFAKFGIPPVVEDFDDHDIHLEEHEKFVLQLEYQALRKSSPGICLQFEEHIKQHKVLNAQRLQAKNQAGVQLA